MNTRKRTFKGYFLSELTFFMIMMLYALFGLTYNLKQLDYFMLASWIYYFLLSFRNEFEQVPIIHHFHNAILNFEKFISRKYTSHFIIDVDYAFKGSIQKSYIYWLGHLSMLFFLVIRLIFVNNTPNVVHVPRITLHQDALHNEEHYQFRNHLWKFWWQTYGKIPTVNFGT